MTKIYEYNNKQYLRLGECNHCGACCLGGWKSPCPMVQFSSDGTTRCKIHEKLGEEDNKEVFEKSGILTKACPEFPNGPGDLFDAEIRNKCGYYFLEIEKILVACPIHECKEYGFQRWIDNVKKFTYPNFEIFCVDNSPNEDFMNRYKDQVPIVHIETNQDPQQAHQRITKSMGVIQKKFLAGDYSRWFNLECDVIPPSHIIELLLEHGKDTDWVAHCYPNRESDHKNVQQGIGCSMLSRRLVESFNFEEADSPDAWLWEKVREANQFHTAELWQYVEVEHLWQ